jgi:hypothetical protein
MSYMLGTYLDIARRTGPRIPIESFCTEIGEAQDRHSLIVDLSATGLRVQRPVGGPRSRILQLEFEVPETDTVVWATGQICFDEVWNLDQGSLSGLMRTSGIRILQTAGRHRRLLREYVNDNLGIYEPAPENEWLFRASCYRFG